MILLDMLDESKESINYGRQNFSSNFEYPKESSLSFMCVIIGKPYWSLLGFQKFFEKVGSV